MKRTYMPVLVGAGQIKQDWTGEGGPVSAPSYVSLAIQAAQKALQDIGPSILSSEIDTITMTRTMEDSSRRIQPQFGRCNNLPRALAKGIGANPKEAIYAHMGGQSPQSLINEMAARIASGECQIALICSTEATGALKTAQRNGHQLDYHSEIEGQLDDRGLGARLLSRPEVKHGLVTPAHLYALFENAYAHRQARDRSAHRQAMGELFSKFTEIAADNPHAQTPIKRTAEFLATPSKDNYPYASPYLKWHMAQDSVNMAAAMILMSDEKADALGIDPEKRIYLHGAGEAEDVFVSERAHLDRSWAMQAALTCALNGARLEIGDISHLDLYSCFPIAVFASLQALELDWRQEPRALTVTGGLPFFGGPGNAYSLHAIASMVERLRRDKEKYGLILANGGWLSKEAAGIYSAKRPGEFRPVKPVQQTSNKLALNLEPSQGKIETFTVIYNRAGPKKGLILARDQNGQRFIDQTEAKDALHRLDQDTSCIGRDVSSRHKDEVNRFEFVSG